MRTKIAEIPLRRLKGSEMAWPLFACTVMLTALITYRAATFFATPLTPDYTFSNNSNSVEATGALRVPDSNVPNAIRIFCWFPANLCQVTVAEIVPEGLRSRFKVVEKSFEITQLSDAKLTATASSTDVCQTETLAVERASQVITLSIGPANSTCTAIPDSHRDAQ